MLRKFLIPLNVLLFTSYSYGATIQDIPDLNWEQTKIVIRANDDALNQDIQDHKSATDPHPGYMLESDIGTGVGDYIQLIDASYCSNDSYTDQSSCETNGGTWNTATGLPFALFDPSGFSGNLDSSYDRFQEILNWLDTVSLGGGASIINDLTDVDTSTSSPTTGQALKWDGAKWTPQADNTAAGAGYVATPWTYSDEACTPGQYAIDPVVLRQYLCASSGDIDYIGTSGYVDWDNPAPVNYTLNIDSTGWGAGDTVTGTGINCPGDCTEDYIDGTNVSLTATPGNDRQFDSWTGALTGTTNPVSVAMTANRTVGANFSDVGVSAYEDFEGAGTPAGWTVTHGAPDFDYTTTVLNGAESLRYLPGGNPLRFETSSIGISGTVYIGFIVNITTYSNAFQINLQDSSDNILAEIQFPRTSFNALSVQVIGGSEVRSVSDSLPTGSTRYVKVKYTPSNGSSDASLEGWVSSDGTNWASSVISSNTGSPTANLDTLRFSCNYETIDMLFDDIIISSSDFNF